MWGRWGKIFLVRASIGIVTKRYISLGVYKISIEGLQSGTYKLVYPNYIMGYLRDQEDPMGILRYGLLGTL